MAARHILVVANDPATVQSVNSLLAGCPYDPEAISFGGPALSRIHRDPMPELVLLQLDKGQSEGLQTLKQFLEFRPDLKVIVLSRVGDSGRVVEAIRMGAHDYITFPCHQPELLQVINRHVNGEEEADSQTTESVEEVGGGHFFLSASPLMQKVRLQVEILANIDVPVLILGESGTGKEVTAHLIHKLSARSERRFLKVNCAALPGELSEMFGYQRGASSGSMRTKAGRVELCDGGTILLDEVADMSAPLQAKLLHILQDHEFVKEGGKASIADVRILAATNVNIQQATGQRRFREDLYYRLSAFTIFLPPLRERQEEIPVLLHHFMQRIAAQYSRIPLPFSARLMDACLHYTWPGNLRELQNFAKRYLVMADEGVAIGELSAHQRRKSVPVETFPDRARQTTLAVQNPVLTAQERAHDLKFLIRNVKDETEIQAITKALDETSWNRKSAARLLHISYRGLLYKLRRHGITRLSSYGTPVCRREVDDRSVEHSEEAAPTASEEQSSSTNDAQLSTPSRRVSNVTVLSPARNWRSGIDH